MSLVNVDIAAEASKYEIFDVITQIDRFNIVEKGKVLLAYFHALN